MYRYFLAIILLMALTLFALAYGMAQETPAAEEAEEIQVEAGQIKLPLRNPFTPQLPIPVQEAALTESQQFLADIQEGPESIVTRTIDFIEPKITGMPRLYISGIIWNSERPQAIVNGSIVEVGDRLFKIPTDNKEIIPEIKFVDISKEGLAVAYEDKIVIIKPELPKE